MRAGWLRSLQVAFCASCSSRPSPRYARRSRLISFQSSRAISSRRSPANKPIATAGRMSCGHARSSRCASLTLRMPIGAGGTLTLAAWVTGLLVA